MKLYRSAGFDDEVILGGMAPHELPPKELPGRERRQLIRKKLNRWEAALGRQPIRSERSALGYALQTLGDDWITISRDPGWSPDHVESIAEMRRTARQLERQAAAAVAAARAGQPFAVPAGRVAENYARLVESKVAALNARTEDERRDASSPVRRHNLKTLSEADRKRLGF